MINANCVLVESYPGNVLQNRSKNDGATASDGIPAVMHMKNIYILIRSMIQLAMVHWHAVRWPAVRTLLP